MKHQADLCRILVKSFSCCLKLKVDVVLLWTKCYTYKNTLIKFRSPDGQKKIY